jgi:hypothetical protein
VQAQCAGTLAFLTMPVVESRVIVPVPPDIAFAVSQTTGEVRMRWDTFIREQRFLDGAERAAKGVRTLTVSRRGARMTSEYVSFSPPTAVGMKILDGPWFFERLGGGWRFVAVDGGTEAVWRYNFRCRTAAIRWIAERIGTWLTQRDIDRRIAGFARGCSDPIVLASARDIAATW